MTSSQIVLLAFGLLLLAFLAGVIRTVLRVRTMRRALDPNNPDPAAREKLFKEVGKRANEKSPPRSTLCPRK